MLLELRNVSKSYGSQQVLEPTSLGVADGEFITVLGPSGSGKTTILRIIGGFTQPSSGEVRFANENITGVPTHRRPFNTVFQDYALFPHMTVAENVGYGLRIRGAARSARAKTAAENLELVGLAKFAERYPAQLSGGQKQRVALARALVCRPKLLLLDEPLAALDAELRKQMQLFLKQLQRQVRTTFLFVTHDQEEAMSISDRIVVMNVGKIEQIGAPKEIYHAPKTPFVASFFGDNNIIPGHVARKGEIELPFGTVPTAEDFAVDTDVTVAIRPEALRLNGALVANRLRFPCRVEDISFAGALTQMVLRPEAAPEQKLMIKLAGDELRDSPASGSRVEVSLPHDGLISLRRR